MYNEINNALLFYNNLSVLTITNSVPPAPASFIADAHMLYQRGHFPVQFFTHPRSLQVGNIFDLLFRLY